MIARQDLTTEIIDLIEKNQDEVRLWLFVANCCLLGEENKERIKESLSLGIATRLTRATKKDYLTAPLQKVLKEGLNNQKISFINLLKAFIEKQTLINFKSASEYILTLLKIVNDIRQANYRVESIPSSTSRLIRNFFSADEVDNSDNKILGFTKNKRNIVNIPAHLARNEALIELALWGQNQDKSANDEIKQKALRLQNAKKSANNRYTILFTIFLIPFAIAFYYVTLALGSVEFAYCLAFIIPTLSIIPHARNFRNRWKAVRENDDAIELNDYKGKKEKIAQDLSEALKAFFDIKLSQNIVGDLEKKAVPQPISITIVPSKKVEQAHPQIEPVEEVKLPKRNKRVWRMVNEAPDTNTTASVARAPQRLEYESTTTHLIRRIRNGSSETTVMFLKSLKNVIDHQMYPLYKKTFLEKGFVTKGTGLRFLNKDQMEIKVKTYKHRVMGDTREFGPAYEFNQFSNRGLHVKRSL